MSADFSYYMPNFSRVTEGMVLLAAPKQQEPLPPVVLPEPIDSSVFLAKEYRPRPLAFLKPFGAHVPRVSTPRSDMPASTSVRGVHVRGAVEEARLPFDSYATQPIELQTS